MEPGLPCMQFKPHVLPARNPAVIHFIEVAHFGGYRNIIVREGQRPPLRHHEIRVIVKACAVNYNDIYSWQGLYVYNDIRPPFTMGLECSGEVEEVGKEVKDFKVGDRVMCWNFKYGMWTENLCISPNNCFKIPDSMTYEEAAAFPISYVAAYIAIMEYGNLKPGHVVYVQTAGGGFGCAATQLANTIDGVTVIGCSSAAKHKTLLNKGLKYCFDSSNKDKEMEIRKRFPGGIDLILCNIIGADVDKNRQLLKPFGRFIHVGAVNLPKGDRKDIFHVLKLIWQRRLINPVELMHDNRCECGFNVATLFDMNPEVFRSKLKEVLSLYEKRLLDPIIDSIWSFSQVNRAISHIMNRYNIGKVILVPEEASPFGDLTEDDFQK